MAAAPTAETSGPPDFVGVGAQRCGTTWWFKVLSTHPGIRPPKGRRKEQHFFDPFAARPLTDEDIAAYHRLFPREPGQVAGEWTPRYMRDFWTPPLLRRAAPDARLLVMLRDPIERYRSGVVHRLTRTPQRRAEAIAGDGIERGRYGLQLRRVLASFPAEQVLVLQYEQCRADPRPQYDRTLRFLGVDDPPQAPDFEQPRGTTMAPAKRELWPDFERAMQTALEPDIAGLAELVPSLDLSLWPNFSHLA